MRYRIALAALILACAASAQSPQATTSAINVETGINVPGRVFRAAGFGIVSSLAPARRIQLGLRLTF